MKKLFALALLLCLATPFVSAQQTSVLMKNIGKKLVESSSTNAHEKGVIMINLIVDAVFLDVEAKNDPIEKKCPAVRIAPNTLLASRACIDLSGKGTLIQSGGGSGDLIYSERRVARWVSSIKIEGVTIGEENFREDGKLLLIAIDGSNEKLQNAIQKMPIVDLFVAQDAESLKTTFPEITLNRNDMLWGRECAPVDVVNVCTEEQCFKICWKAVRGDTGDPVFGRNPDTNNLEYLLGFNVTNSDKDGRNPGRWYHFLSASSLDFFKKNLLKQEWDYIKKHVKDETLYN